MVNWKEKKLIQNKLKILAVIFKTIFKIFNLTKLNLKVF